MKIGLLTALAAAGMAMAMSTAAWAQSLPLPQGSYRNSCNNARAMQVPGGGRLLTAQCRTSNGSVRNTSLRFENCRGDIANNNGNLTCSNLGGGVGGARPPSGSYQQSCRDAEMRGSTLTAACRDNRGRWQNSSINVNDCRGRDIANDNGRLTCSRGGGATPPSGSYQQSCRDAEMRGSTLTAACRDNRGRWQNSSINVNDCRGRDIANDNGRLTCSRGGGATPPSGSYQQSCRDARMQGSTLSASCRDNRGRWQNSSINVNDCRGRDIANDNGRLTCSRGGGGGGGGGGSGPIPNGSFQSTCRNAVMNGFTLTAQCRLTFGSQTRTSSIDVRTCSGRDIVNLNGVLICR